jgi:purine-nucleoside phosphorylase
MSSLLEKIAKAKNYILGLYSQSSSGTLSPEIGIILGTGLGPIAQSLQVELEIPYADIPHFMRPTVDGHTGKLLLGHLNGKSVVMMQGRFHFYEGFSMEEIAFPVRLMQALGIKSLLITNIAGGVYPSFSLGDIMVIKDHINLLGANPLIGINQDCLGPRFPDMSEPYSRDMMGKLMAIGDSLGIRLQKGVYACMSGPCLETAAEYRMLKIIGADAVGMSTVPEVIAAVHGGLKVAALSLITDVCDPDDLKPINIPEIMRVVGEAEPRLAALVGALVSQI